MIVQGLIVSNPHDLYHLHKLRVLKWLDKVENRSHFSYQAEGGFVPDWLEKKK